MRKILFYCILITINIFSFADEPKIVEEKTTIFSYDIFNPHDLYMALEGSWTFDLETFASGNISSAFENLTFSQVPEISASVWLFNKYFFETKITDETDENIFILGYQNSDTLLQEVRIGNDDLEIESYAGYTPSINTEYAPGARAKILSSTSQHEILGRYTSESNDTVKYIGYYYLEDETFTINEYVKEKFFILPFDDFDDIELYTMDDDGDLTALSDQEYLFNTSENQLYLEDNDDTIYLSLGSRTQTEYEEALYDFIDPENNPGITDGTSKEDLWDKYIEGDIDDGNYIKLTDTGYSPFDQMGSYELESLTDVDEDDLNIYLDGEQIINYTIYDDYILIKDSDITYNNLEARYPFINEDSEIYSAGGAGLTSSYTLEFQELTAVTEITVPDDAKENSLSITINGTSYSSFTHDSDSGVVTFDKEISSFDEIIINYKMDSSSGTDNLLLSYGSRYELNDNLTLDLSHTASWDFSGDDYSYDVDENVGSLISRGKLNYTGEKLSVDLSTTIYASTPDTTDGYMLFEYEKGEIDIPVGSIELDDSNNNGIALIKREYDDLVVTYDEISSLELDDSGGAYTVYHSESSSSSEVIVIETEDLSSSEYSLVDIDLDDYSDDYSWATSFSVDIMNSEDRDITFTFSDDDESTDTTLSREVSVATDSDFETYTFEFSSDDREKLTNLDLIRVTVNEGDADIILIKNMMFVGDSLVTHNGSTDFTLIESDSTMELETTATFNEGDDIEISSAVSSVNITNYGTLNFTINNSSMLDNSTITMTLEDDGESYAELIIPGGLDSGENEIIVDIDDNSVTINGATVDGVTWENSDATITSFTLNFENCSTGSMVISEIILEDPIWDFYSQSSLDIEYSPEISLKIGEIPMLDNIKLSAENNFISGDSYSYNVTGNLDMDLLGMTLSSSIYYNDSIERIEYKVTLPTVDSPIILSDQFSYDSDRFRLNSLNISSNIVNVELKASDALGDDSGIRNTELNIDSSLKSAIKFTSYSKLSQYRSDSVDDINKELSQSYTDLLPENSLDEQNNLSQTMELSFNSTFINSEFAFEGELDQDNESTQVDTNSYMFTIGGDISLFGIILSPSFNSMYEYIDNVTKIDNLYTGIDQYLSIFSDSNPYKNLTIYETFFSTDRTDFFDSCNDDSYRSIESEFSLSFTHNKTIPQPLNIFIPKKINYSINKELAQEESLETSSLDQEITATFNINSEIKNSITLGRDYDIEEDETDNSLDWDFVLYRELKKDTFLDISNALTISTDDGCTNITNAELEWPGKSGPILVLPLLDKVFDAPYSYTHNESLYLNFTSDISEYIWGLKHETILTVKDMNETSFYIDIGWDNGDDDMFSLELGLYTTLIF